MLDIGNGSVNRHAWCDTAFIHMATWPPVDRPIGSLSVSKEGLCLERREKMQ